MGNFTALALLLVLIPFIVITAAFFSTPPLVFASHSRIDLLTTDNFAVLAGSAINDTTPSRVTGDVGLSPASGTFIGVTCGEVTGTIYSVDAAGPLPCRVTNAGLLTTAKNDLTTAYNNAAARPTTGTIGTELGGAILTDGTFDSASTTFEISAGQTLTLNGQGNPNAVFIFKMGTTLTTFANSRVVLTNSAQACNVYWQVGSSATIGTGTSFIGTVMADQSITDNGGSTVNGRFLARVAAVTLNNTTISKPSCAAGTTGGPSLNASSGSGGSGTTVCPTISNFIAPNIIESRRIDADSIFISWGPYSGTNTFIVQYGLENGNWLYSTNVTGFSTTLNGLPSNQPIWIRIAARNSCSIGQFGEAKLVGGPLLPNTGIGPKNYFPWYIPASILIGISVLLISIQGKHRFSSRHEKVH